MEWLPAWFGVCIELHSGWRMDEDREFYPLAAGYNDQVHEAREFFVYLANSLYGADNVRLVTISFPRANRIDYDVRIHLAAGKNLRGRRSFYTTERDPRRQDDQALGYFRGNADKTITDYKVGTVVIKRVEPPTDKFTKLKPMPPIK